MSQNLYTAVDNYLAETLITPDPVMDAVLKSCEAAGLPAIAVTPTQGKFLQIIARIINARRILEIGTLGGYSTIWLARALPPNGQLVTLEFNPKHAEVAQENFRRANVESLVNLHIRSPPGNPPQKRPPPPPPPPPPQTPPPHPPPLQSFLPGAFWGGLPPGEPMWRLTSLSTFAR